MSLRSRIALILATIVLLAVGIAAIGSTVSSAGVGRNRIDKDLNERVEQFIRSAEQGERAAVLALCDQVSDRRGNDRRDLVSDDSIVQYLTNDGKVIPFCGAQGNAVQGNAVQGNAVQGNAVQTDPAGSIALPISSSDVKLIGARGKPKFRDISIDGEPYRLITAPAFEGAVQVARSLDDVDSVVSSLSWRIAIFGAIGAAVAGGVGWLAAGRATRPIEALTATSEAVARTQDLSHRMPVERDDEVGRLATSFNTMLAALDTSRQQQSQLVQDANHELRTPLTSLRTNIELLQRHRNLPEHEENTLLTDIHTELDQLTLLVGELVESATDVASSSEAETEFDLRDVADTVAERFRRRSGRMISVLPQGSTDASSADASSAVGTTGPVTGRVTLIERAISNLVDNAVKFSPEGAPIEVLVGDRRVEVLDRGPGIADGDQDRIFDRFHRAVEARSQPGSGLGLAIVRQIVESHGGTVWARNRPGGGASVGFELNA